MSTVGAPVAVDANKITGSSMVVMLVSIAVVFPLTVRFPEIVKFDPYVKLLAILPALIE